MNNIATIGHNQPPTPTEILKSQLHERHQPLIDQAVALLCEPKIAICEDEKTSGEITDLIGRLNKHRKVFEAQRESEKAPHWEACKTVDNFFKYQQDLIDKDVAARKPVLDKYLKAKAEEEARERKRAADVAAAEAKKALEAAEYLESECQFQHVDGALNDAADAEAAAKEAAKAAEVKTSSLGKTRGYSSSASLRTRWVGEVTGLGILDLESLRPHINAEALQKAVNSFVAAGGRNLRGASIYEKTETTIR